MENLPGYSPSDCTREIVTGNDSKISRQFLRMIAYRIGHNVPDDQTMNSWELYEMIERSIELMRLEISRQRKVIKGLISIDSDRRQQTIKAIGDFYDK